MIRYNKIITLDLRRNGQWRIISDRGEEYETQLVNGTNHIVTDWWKNQYQSDLRQWQKDICIGYAWDIFGRLDLYNIYKHGQGYNQPHDMTLCHSSQYNIWIFSTNDDFWLSKSKGGQVVFNVDDSMGSILDKETRLSIGNVFDQLKDEYNPENLSHTKL